MRGQAVNESAGAYRVLFERSPSPVLLVDPASLRVLRANHAAAAEYGYRPEELVDLPLTTLWPRAEEGLAQRKPAQAVWRHVRRGGEAIDVELRFQDVAFAGQPAVALHFSNVTHRAFSTALLEAQNRLLDLIARGGALAYVLEELVLAMERLSGGMTGSLLLVDEDGRRARHGAAPNLPPPYWKAVDGLEIGPRAGTCGTAMYLGRLVVTSDIALDPLWDDYRALALPHGLRACWSMPVRSSTGRVLGAFAMYYREPNAPSGHDLRLVEAGAALAAIAIEREHADRTLKQSEARLRAIVDHASALVLLKDAEGRYLMVNRRFEEVTGVPAAVALGRTDRQLFDQATADACTAHDRQVLESGRPFEFEEEIRHVDAPRVYLAVKFPLRRADGSAYAIGCVATDITERRRWEWQLHGVREEERVRISRDIHDHLGQMLTVLRMNLALLIRSLRDSPVLEREALAVQLQSIEELVGRLIDSVRRIVTELRPEVLDSLGLAAALEWQAEEFSRRTGIACTLSLPGGAVEVGPERATALFRISQEALSNAARHSGADLVEIELRRDGAFLEMRIADDGRGIAPQAGETVTFGLRGMRERAAMLGGSATIAGAPGKGTTVTVRLPE
ncbi:MAG TPA: PAS domain-containing protein [Burkholderiales bacterium]|nr:PAS domain-containing protein [Burkholderiales bacterium]